MKTNLTTLIGALLVFAFAIATLSMHWREIPWNPARIAGLILVLVALPFFVMARLQLGASFSVDAKAQVLVTHGLYKYIRNPIYVFGGAFVIGIALFMSPWLALALLVVTTPIQIIRARKEEQVLTEAFGDEYRNYKKNTWF